MLSVLKHNDVTNVPRKTLQKSASGLQNLSHDEIRKSSMTQPLGTKLIINHLISTDTKVRNQVVWLWYMRSHDCLGFVVFEIGSQAGLKPRMALNFEVTSATPLCFLDLLS